MAARNSNGRVRAPSAALAAQARVNARSEGGASAEEIIGACCCAACLGGIMRKQAHLLPAVRASIKPK